MFGVLSADLETVVKGNAGNILRNILGVIIKDGVFTREPGGSKRPELPQKKSLEGRRVSERTISIFNAIHNVICMSKCLHNSALVSTADIISCQ